MASAVHRMRYSAIFMCCQFFVAFAAGCTNAKNDDVYALATPLCVVHQDRTRFDGKEMLLRAEYWWLDGAPMLSGGSDCPEAQIMPRFLPAYRAEKDATRVIELVQRNGGRAEAVYRGVFRLIDDSRCRGMPGCHWGTIEIAELVSARTILSTTIVN